MDKDTPNDRGYRFPAEIISHAVWLYYRFSLSLRDVEDLLAKPSCVRPTTGFGARQVAS